MTVTPQQARANLDRLTERERSEVEARTERLRAQLPAAAARLRELGARQVIAFGSLVVGEPWARSDVDIAVKGLPPNRYFLALAELLGLFGCPVDLVCLEDAPASLVLRVAEEGRPL